MITLKDIIVLEKLRTGDWTIAKTIPKLYIKNIELQIRTFRNRNIAIFFICLCSDKTQYYISIISDSYWRFQKPITKNLLYGWLDNKTWDDLTSTFIAYVSIEDPVNSSLLYKIKRHQFIKL